MTACRLTRRRALAALATLSVGATAAAQDRTRPITLVVPFAAGGGTDTVARLLAQKMHAALGTAVVVDNRPGANGLVASRSVLQQPADGRTVLLGSQSTHVIAPLAARQAADGIQAVRAAFTMVGVVADAPLVLAVRAASVDTDLAGFLRRARGTELSYGTFGAGSSAHVLGEVLAEGAQARLLHVPYRGSAPALTDLLGGQVDSVFLTVAAIEGAADAGTVRPLAVTGKLRVRALPKVPTFEELGARDLSNAGWFALFVASGTPADELGRLSDAMRQALALPEVRAKLVDLGLEPVGGTPREGRDTWDRSVALAAPIVKRARIEF